jgi:hypothetical protein
LKPWRPAVVFFDRGGYNPWRFTNDDEETIMRTLAIVLFLAVLAVALPSGAPSAQEYVVHTFKCPPSTTVKLNWKNKIETQPTNFPVSPSYENLTQSAQFRESAANLSANTVQCLYVIPQTVFQAPYVYKVHRKILSCTGMPAAEFTCNLKKD